MGKKLAILHPLSWVSAVLLYVFLGVFGSLAGPIVMMLRELAETSPRLAWLGGLLLFASPSGFVAGTHHILHGVLDKSEKANKRGGRGFFPDLLCWWAGVYAWGVIFLSTVVSTFAVLIVSPPDPDRGASLGDALVVVQRFAWMQDARVLATVQTFAWLGTAALLYELERRMRAKAAAGQT